MRIFILNIIQNKREEKKLNKAQRYNGNVRVEFWSEVSDINHWTEFSKSTRRIILVR